MGGSEPCLRLVVASWAQRTSGRGQCRVVSEKAQTLPSTITCVRLVGLAPDRTADISALERVICGGSSFLSFPSFFGNPFQHGVRTLFAKTVLDKIEVAESRPVRAYWVFLVQKPENVLGA